MPEPLEVHHLNYDRIGSELDIDLEVLCRECHVDADKEREERVSADADDRRYSARLDGWASKVYGENWAESSDGGEAAAEDFERWLDDQPPEDW